MSLLIVENVTHGFGGRRILEDASFRLLKGEHVGLIGANGEGKSTFLNISVLQTQRGTEPFRNTQSVLLSPTKVRGRTEHPSCRTMIAKS